MLQRIQTLDTRIKNSETFPRIRDAEEEMRRNEMAFLNKLKLKHSKKKRDLHNSKKKKVNIVVNPTIKKEKAPLPQKQYFTGFVLNKDPLCSKYMPFDEVYFPKLFNESEAAVGPQTIDSLWMLGFEDLAKRRALPPIKTAKPKIAV